MRIIGIAQARMASQRLPGKVLKDLGGRKTLDWVTTALKNTIGIDEVVVATSVNPENDRIADWCDTLYHCVRGSEDDVLDRYRQVIEETKADVVIRVTADCPLLDSRVISECIALYKSGSYDYVSNIDPPTFPDGMDAEVISSRAIIAAAKGATRQIDRDTVTRFIARNKTRFSAGCLVAPLPNLHQQRWVLDSPEDYEFLKALVDEFPPNWQPNYLEILNLLNTEPKLRALHEKAKKYTRNQRFYESLSEEKPYNRSFSRSQAALTRAKNTIPLGSQTFSKSYIQYPAGASPLFLSHGDGGYAYDVDGNDYVDLVSGLLPNVLGYRDPDVDYAVRQQLNAGISFSLATELEADLSERLVRLIPCAEMVRFGKNGADVTAAAIRIARAHTSREKIMMLQSGYHGWHDWSIASTERNLGVPKRMPGLTARASGDLNKIGTMMHDEEYACIIVEPEGRTVHFLKNLQELCLKNNVLLIFDEVITGFRWALGGYQQHIGVTPDLATFGKAMANGMPLSAIVGRKDLMTRFEPPKNVFYSGTFFGETLSLAASIATIDKMKRENVIDHLWQTGTHLKDSVKQLIIKHKLEHVIYLFGDGPRVQVGFHDGNKLTKDQLKAVWMKDMIADGVLVIASHNICYAHGAPEINKVISTYDRALGKLSEALSTGKPTVSLDKTASVR